jgi:hypothetical protein
MHASITVPTSVEGRVALDAGIWIDALSTSCCGEIALEYKSATLWSWKISYSIANVNRSNA